MREECARVALAMNIELSATQCELLLIYLKELAHWNQAFNLTAIRDPREMLIKHIFDTFSIAHYIVREKIIDVGTGAGIPGIILSVLFPQKKMTLLDSNGKKTRFLVHIKGKLGLDNVDVVHERVEKYQPAEQFDCILARAFASVEDVIHLCEHLCGKNGQYLLMKGHFPTEEIKALGKEYSVNKIELTVPELFAERHLLVIEKG